MSAPDAAPSGEPGRPARYGVVDGDRIVCRLCPRHCRLREGQRGFCFVRTNVGGRLWLSTWGRSSGFCIDPIEKKPLHHFLPGSAVLSFGTAGCNLACRFCQNWDISTARDVDRLADAATPEAIAAAARAWGCDSVAFTYNDPVVFAEYAIDVAEACRAVGVRTVAVTAGYVEDPGRTDLFAVMDAANVDLKGFTDDFYVRLTGGHLRTVLDTLEHLAATDTWLEITTLLIPGHNDADAELAALCRWVVDHLGPDVPRHCSAFHPDHRLRGVPRTPPATLTRASRIALDAGVRYPYTGNVHDRVGDTTFCPGCGLALVERDWYELGAYRLVADATGSARCPDCGTPVAGRFAAAAGAFGARRIPIRIG